MARVARKNKQKMFYSNFVGQTDIYKKDEDGNTVYVEVDGELVPVKAGEKQPYYSQPIEFRASISGKLNDAIIRAFGADESDNHAQLVVAKGVLPIKLGTRIWLHSEVKFIDIDKTMVDGASADYEVRGELREGLTEDLYYLVVLNHEKDDE